MSGVVGLATTIPFAVNYFFLHADPGFTELALRQGLVSDHKPIVSIWLVLMLGAVLFVWPKMYKKSRVFFIVLVASLWILTDQNLITGVTLHPSHYHWYITKPLLGLMLGMYAAFVLHFLFKEMRYIKALSVAAMLFVLCYTSPVFHMEWYKNNPDTSIVAAQKFEPVLTLLNTLTEKQVVWADGALSQYVSIYTKHDAPNNPYNIYYLNPQSFYEDTLFLSYRLAGETPATILATLTKDRVFVSERVFGLYYRQATGDLANIPDEVLQTLAQKYAEFYARPYTDIFKELQISAVIGPSKEAVSYAKIQDLKLFKVAGDYTLYSLK